MRTLLERDMKFQQTALNLRAHRQQILSSNIANADTPNYKAQDIDFKRTLDTMLGKTADTSSTPLAMARTSSAHLTLESLQEPLDRFRRFRTESQSSVDGNTVNMDVERAAFAENAIQYEASITFINGMLRSMQQAIAGQ